MKAEQRGAGTVRRPTRPGTGRTPRPPKESQPDVRAKPSLAGLSDLVSAPVRGGQTETVIATKSS